MKPMNTLRDVVEEAKVRTVFWAICVFGISYFLSHTSKSMWINIPISVLILAAFRYLSYEVELRWKVRPVRRRTYLSHLEQQQLSVDVPRLSLVTTTSRWRRKIDSPLVETAIDDFINKILQDFVVDLWYSSITPDKEAPELIRTLILDVLGEISGRIKEINLVELLTRDMVDLIGNQLDLFRKSQSEIGLDIMGTLSFEERDERLKRHLMASRELHPALVSPEFEHKVLQQMIGGLLSIVLRPQEAQCPLVHSISRELLTCLVVQPIMNFASPVYVNELIEYIFLSNNDNAGTEVVPYRSPEATYPAQGDKVSEANMSVVGPEHSRAVSSTQPGDLVLSKADRVASGLEQGHQTVFEEALSLPIQPRAAEWALLLEAATKRRTQVLAPENLENMWTKGRNYKKKTAKLMQREATSGSGKIDSVIMSTDIHARDTGKELSTKANKNSADLIREEPSKSFHSIDGPEETMRSVEITNQLKRSSSTPDMDTSFTCKSGENIIYKDYYSSNSSKHEESNAELASRGEGSSYVPKLKCRWTPPNVSVPLLNLVDNIFQLNRRGWLRRQVFWISKQILQLMMEDAIDDWILRQIHWLRKDEVVAHGIHWVQDILWPNGTFFIKFRSSEEKADGIDFNQKSAQNRSHQYSDKVGGPSSFEFQLEAARRASDVKKMILGGAPTALVSLIGHRQYRRCAKDVYYFLQSSVCLKQLGYCMLELVIVSIFPELRDLIIEVHKKSQANQVISEAI